MELRIAVLLIVAGLVSAAGAQQPGSASPPKKSPSAPTDVRSGAKTLEHVSISQVVVSPPDISMYLDIGGASDSPIDVLPPESMQAWIDGKPVPVRSLKPFSHTPEGIAYVFLVDVSRSESRGGFAAVQKSLGEFIDQMGARDKAAIISFGEETRNVATYTGDKAALKLAVSGLVNDSRMTHLNAAIVEGLLLAQKTDVNLPSRRGIVVLSDGKDEGSGLTTDDVLRKLEDSRIPIYAIGASSLPSTQREVYLEVLHRYTVLSGGAYYPAATSGISSAYTQVHDRTARVWVADLNCSACVADGGRHSLQVRVSVAGQALGDKVGITLLPVPPAAPSAVKPLPIWKRYSWKVYAGAGAGLAVLLGGLIWLLRRRNSRAPSNEEDGAKFQSLDSEGSSEPVFPPYSFSLPGFPRESESAEELTGRPGWRVELIRKESRPDVPRSYIGKLVDQIVVGRAPGSAIQIPDKEVSGQHCRLELVNGYVLVSDLGSTFGTSINGIPVKARQKVESGDWIALGQVVFRVRLQE